MSRSNKGKDQAVAEGSSSATVLLLSDDDRHQHNKQQHHQPSSPPAAAPLSRYESQKRRDWNTFCQYLKNQRPPVNLLGGHHQEQSSSCNSSHVLEFLRYLDQFGKTKVHIQGCPYFGEPEPSGPCACPLRQAWGSLDALIGRLRAAYEENGGTPDTNPFASATIRLYLRDVRDSQAKARGVPYNKKKKRKKIKRMKLSPPPPPPTDDHDDHDDQDEEHDHGIGGSKQHFPIMDH